MRETKNPVHFECTGFFMRFTGPKGIAVTVLPFWQSNPVWREVCDNKGETS